MEFGSEEMKIGLSQEMDSLMIMIHMQITRAIKLVLLFLTGSSQRHKLQ